MLATAPPQCTVGCFNGTNSHYEKEILQHYHSFSFTSGFSGSILVVIMLLSFSRNSTSKHFAPNILEKVPVRECLVFEKIKDIFVSNYKAGFILPEMCIAMLENFG